MKTATKSILAGITFLLAAQLTCSAQDVGGAAATDVSNWTTNNLPFVQGTTDGFALDWENVLTNTVAANVGNNNFEVTFETDQNYTIGHLFLFNESVDLSTLPGGIQQMTWTADFDATGMANWIPVIAVTDGAETNFFRSNNAGNSWNGTEALAFTAGAADSSFWVGLSGDPIGGIDESRVGGFNPDLQGGNGTVQFGFIQWGASTAGIVSPALDFTTAIDQFDITINEVQEVTQKRASSAFGTTYDANEIYDGVDFVNGWAKPGAAGTDVIPALDAGGEFLTLTNNDNNGWIELDNEASPWETGTAAGGSWTAETRVRLAPDVDNAFVLWAANGIERSILQVNTNSVTPFGAAEIDNNDNTDDFHTFRIAYEADFGLYFYWRDGVLLTVGGIAAQAGTGNNRFILGDCCSSYLMTTVDIEYARFDTTGAFAPAPENPLRITEIIFDEATNMVTLTWSSVAGTTYAIDESADLSDWGIEVDDSAEADGNSISVTFRGPEPGTPRRYYRVRVAD